MMVTSGIASSSIERVSAIDESDFKRRYVSAGKPVVITDLCQSWPAYYKWDLAYLAQIAGDELVPLYNSRPTRDRLHQHAAQTHIKLRDFIGLLERGERDLRMFFYNLLENAPALLEDIEYPAVGLKFFRRLPVLFMAGRDAKVQMHYDIDLANLLLCHFGGPKRVLLIDPRQSGHMYQVPFSFSSLGDIDFDDPDFNRYPALAELHGLTTVLQHGEALFIPSGYWHYIYYEEIGFSLTLRALPTHPLQIAHALKNIIWTRTVEGFMRKCFGQRWNDRNERLAVTRTHQLIRRKTPER